MDKFKDHKIMTIDEEKRNRIINAAITEFAKGYRLASTDVIVKEAGISKGLLFHYFGTKKDLFLFIHDYAMRLVCDEFFSLINLKQRDLLERWRQQVFLKIDLCRRYPAIFEFLTAANLGDTQEAVPDIREYNNSLLEQMMPKVFGDIDTSLFREDLPPDKVYEMLMVFIQGYNATALQKHNTFEEFRNEFDIAIAEIDDYIAILKKCFYKQGGY